MSSTHSAFDIFRYYLSLLLGFPFSIFLLSAQVILDFRTLVLSSCHTLTTNGKVHSLWLILTHTHIHTGMNTHTHTSHTMCSHMKTNIHIHTHHTQACMCMHTTCTHLYTFVHVPSVHTWKHPCVHVTHAHTRSRAHTHFSQVTNWELN